MYKLNVNGKVHPVDAEADMPLLWVLREIIGMTGTKYGCGVAQCRACSVIIDNPDGTSETSVTCVVPAQDFAGKSIRTIEGHARTDEKGELQLSPVQQAFLDGFSFQCGYCTPGQIMSGVALLKEGRAKNEAEIRESMSGNLCRCAAYPNIIAAIKETGQA